MSQLLSLCIVLLSGLSVHADFIDHRQEIQTAQEWANQFDRPYPILIFNRDELHFEFLKAEATSDSQEDEDTRNEIVSRYVFDRTQMELTPADLVNLTDRLWLLTSSAQALPLLDGSFLNPEYKFCAVFPNSPNGTQRIETERLTGMDHDGVYGELSYENLNHRMDYEALYLHSLYHEVSHCLDQTYMPEMYSSYEPQGHDVYLAESFAETYSYLKLAQRLGPEFIKNRMVYRILYSRFMGAYLASDEVMSFGDPLVKQGGAIYHLAPSLAKAYEKVRSRLIKLDELSNEELYQETLSIVEESTLPLRSFSAIVLAHEVGFDAAEQRYSDWSFESPEYFFFNYSDLVVYRSQTDLWIERAFTDEPIIEDVTSVALPEINDHLCGGESLNEISQEEFMNRLDVLRQALAQENWPVEERRQVYSDLNNISKTLSCSFTNNIY